MARVIYHHPLPLDRDGASGSSIRPVRMLTALESLAEVWPIAGTSAERARRIAEVRAAMGRGVVFDGVYSESSTLPTALTDDDRVPRHPFMEPAFFRHCRRRGVPVTLFYRDVYWRFPGFAAQQNPLFRVAAKAAFRYDLAWYRGAVDLLYLPSMPMLRHVPISPRVPAKALPPGTVIRETATPAEDGPLEVLYVGGMSDMYDLRRFVEALAGIDGLRLTICTRPEDWETVRAQYEPLMGDNTTVVHQSGAQLTETMKRSHLATVCVEPNLYRSFAAPVKLFDGVGMGIPVVASNGTHAANLVDEFDLGWRVDYTVDDMRRLFTHLATNRDEVTAARQRVLDGRDNHTWEARAAQVLDDLSRLRNG